MSLQAITDNFAVCEYSVFEIVRYLAGVICEKFLAKYISWLNSNQEVHRIT